MPISLPYVSLEFRKDLNIYFLRWQSPVNDEEFRTGYSLILNESDPEKVHCWLFDTRRRGPSSPESENWYFNSYLPELHRKLIYKHYIAVLTTPDHFSYIRDQIGIEKFNDYNKGSLLTMNFFDSEHKAVEWLQAMQLK
jgi:hypothetical protein